MINTINMHKIALITLQNDAEKVPPLGLVCLATWLHERCNVQSQCIKIIDNYCDNIWSELFFFEPTIIGFSSMTIDYKKVVNMAKRIRKRYPDALLVLGGVHISTLPESLDPVFDIGVIGEGEQTIGEIVSGKAKEKIKGIIYYKDGKLVRNPLRRPLDLDVLPIPDFDFVSKKYFRKEEIPGISDTGIKGYMMTSRGCPYRCSFCSTSRFWGNMRMNSPKRTAEIAKDLIEKHNVDFLKVMDDLFTISPERLDEIRKEFEKAGILDRYKGIECQPRANLMSDRLCESMKSLKVKTVNFGFESGSNRMLKYLKGDNSSVKQNMDAVLLCEKYGLNCYGSLIYGSPGETIQDMDLTNQFIDFSIRHKAKYLWSFVATPFPATPFWDIALKRGKVSNDMDWNLLSHHAIEPLLLDSNINIEDFKRTFNEGKSKLRMMKMRMALMLLLRHPLKSFSLVLRSPGYYASRLYRQIFRQ